jgi:hypothetical protein
VGKFTDIFFYSIIHPAGRTAEYGRAEYNIIGTQGEIAVGDFEP